MKRGNYNPFSTSRAPQFPMPVAEPAPAVMPAQAQAIDNRVLESERANARMFQHAGTDTAFVQFGALSPVRFPAFGSPVAIVTFQVPEGRVLVVERVEFALSEPIAYSFNQFGWRPVVNGASIPFYNQTGVIGPPATFAYPLWSVGDSYRLKPFAVQSQETLEIQLIEDQVAGFTTFAEYMAAVCWVYGELKKPVGGVFG